MMSIIGLSLFIRSTSSTAQGGHSIDLQTFTRTISQSIRELTHILTSTHHVDRVWCCEDIVDAVCSVLDAVCVVSPCLQPQDLR